MRFASIGNSLVGTLAARELTQITGYRPVAAASGCDALSQPIRKVSDLIADYAPVGEIASSAWRGSHNSQICADRSSRAMRAVVAWAAGSGNYLLKQD
jgi:hypothetical protein